MDMSLYEILFPHHGLISSQAYTNHSTDRRDVYFSHLEPQEALQRAQKHVLTHPGMALATAPEILVRSIAKSLKHQSAYLTQSEEIIGIDKKGYYGKKESPVVVVLHGVSMSTPIREQRAQKRTHASSMKTHLEIDEYEFSHVLAHERLTIPTMSIDEALVAANPIPRVCALVVPYQTVCNELLGSLSKYVANGSKLLLARVGADRQTLNDYFSTPTHRLGHYFSLPSPKDNVVSIKRLRYIPGTGFDHANLKSGTIPADSGTYLVHKVNSYSR